MQKIVSLIAVTCFLTACGSSGDTESLQDDGSTFADLAGVWNATQTLGQLVDERYVVFKQADPTEAEIQAGVTVYNTVVTYDYEADSVDLGKNCYRESADRITALGFGDFEITTLEIKDHVDDPDVILDQYIVHAEVSAEELTIVHDGLTSIYPKSDFDEEYYSSKLCDDSDVILF